MLNLGVGCISLVGPPCVAPTCTCSVGAGRVPCAAPACPRAGAGALSPNAVATTTTDHPEPALCFITLLRYVSLRDVSLREVSLKSWIGLLSVSRHQQSCVPQK